MAKETPVIQNSKILMLSLGLALLVVVLYNVQINKIRTEAKGTTVKLLQYKIEKRAGETITDRGDVQVVEIDKKAADGLKSAKTDEDLVPGGPVLNHKLVRGVAAGDWVQTNDLDSGEGNNRSPVPNGEGLISIPIDPMYSPGRMLHLGDRVNVLGEVQIKPGQFKVVRLIDGLVVRSIGGKSINDVKPGEDASSTPYREIGSSLPRQPKDMVMQWYNVLSYVKGGRAILELRNQRDPVSAEIEFGPEVKEKTEKADPTHGTFIPAGGGSSPMAPPL